MTTPDPAPLDTHTDTNCDDLTQAKLALPDDDQALSAVMAEVVRLMVHPADNGTRTCTVPGCDRTHWGRGLCQAHYMRQARTGHPGSAPITQRPAREALCTVPGCDQAHQARGWCRTHYSRWHRTGDPQPARPVDPHTCGVPGCPLRHYRRGLCRNHFRRWQQTGGALPGWDLIDAAQRYREGATAAGLARLYGITRTTVLARLRAADVPIRPPGTQRRRTEPSAPPTSPRHPTEPSP